MPPEVQGSRRRQPASEQRVLKQALWLVLALAVIGGALFAGSLVFGDDSPSASRPSPSIAPLTPTPSTSGTPSPSGSPSPSATATPSATAAGMRSFLGDYLQAVADDPATAWGNLTPGFQRTSGGFQDYRSFWAPITQAQPSDVRPDPDQGTISYDVRYTYADGHTTTDSTRLTLRPSAEGYEIAGEG